MYKNLNATALGISGRQSELIELAMTYGFKGLDIDLNDLVKRSKRSSFEHASRYLKSAEIGVSGFEVPIDLDADEDAFAKAIDGLPDIIDMASKVEAKSGSLRLPSATDRLPFNEYFDVLRKRVDQIAVAMSSSDLRLGLYFSAAEEFRKGKEFKFIHDTEGFLAFYKAVAQKAIGVTIDTWSWTIGGGTLEHLGGIDPTNIVSLRLADAEVDVDRETASYKNRLMPGEDRLVPNTEIVKHLFEAGYEGQVAAAGHQSTLTGMTRDAIVSLAQDCLDKVLTSAGAPTETRKPEMFVDLYQPAYANAE